MELRGLLLDLDGTLYTGDRAIPGALEALQRLKLAGLTLRYVTNTTRMPRRAVCESLLSMGFDVRETEILTPARTAAAVVGHKTCFPLVEESLMEDLEDIVLKDEEPDYVLVGDIGEAFDYAKLNAAFRHLMDGAELVALQKNRYWQKQDGPSLDAGPFVAALEYAAGKTATVVGKPEQSFFDLALDGMGLEPHEAAMVGDDAEADVDGARDSGLRGIQVRTGKYRRGVESAGADLIVESIADLPDALGV